MTPDPTTARRGPRRRLAPTALLGTALAVSLTLAGCSGSSSGAAADMAEPMPASDGGGSELGYAEENASSADRDLAGTATTDQLVVVTGWVTVVVDDPVEKAARVATLVESQGGRISSRSHQSAGEGRNAYATLTARIPADKVSDVLDALEEYGSVEESQLDSTEVTGQVRDLDARIRAMEISVNRLEDLLSRSGDLADIVQAEQVLTDRQSQLEQLQSERDALADQVALSTVTINLYTDQAVPDDPPIGFMAGLASGWKAMVSFFTWLAGTLGVLLPWLALLAVLALVGWPLARRRSARRAAQRAAAAPRPAGPTTTLPTAPVPAPPGAVQPPPASTADVSAGPDTSRE